MNKKLKYRMRVVPYGERHWAVEIEYLEVPNSSLVGVMGVAVAYGWRVYMSETFRGMDDWNTYTHMVVIPTKPPEAGEVKVGVLKCTNSPTKEGAITKAQPIIKALKSFGEWLKELD